MTALALACTSYKEHSQWHGVKCLFCPWKLHSWKQEAWSVENISCRTHHLSCTLAASPEQPVGAITPSRQRSHPLPLGPTTSQLLVQGRKPEPGEATTNLTPDHTQMNSPAPQHSTVPLIVNAHTATASQRSTCKDLIIGEKDASGLMCLWRCRLYPSSAQDRMRLEQKFALLCIHLMQSKSNKSTFSTGLLWTWAAWMHVNSAAVIRVESNLADNPGLASRPTCRWTGHCQQLGALEAASRPWDATFLLCLEVPL